MHSLRASGVNGAQGAGAGGGVGVGVGVAVPQVGRSKKAACHLLDACIADCALFLLLSSAAMECSPSPPPL